MTRKPAVTAEVDVCPVCGFVKRARGPVPGLCPEAFRHPGSASERAPYGTARIQTRAVNRTPLVRVRASWRLPGEGRDGREGT